jgi:hypothetical protein
MTKRTKSTEVRKKERFQPIGKHLVVSTRIALDPRADADIIKLLRHTQRNGMANLIRVALRTCYQTSSRHRTKAQPTIELLAGNTGVILSDRLAAEGAQQIVIYPTDLQRVLTELAVAQSQLMRGRVDIPKGVTLPLLAERK